MKEMPNSTDYRCIDALFNFNTEDTPISSIQIETPSFPTTIMGQSDQESPLTLSQSVISVETLSQTDSEFNPFDVEFFKNDTEI